jgi:hypothetical protein
MIFYSFITIVQWFCTDTDWLDEEATLAIEVRAYTLLRNVR